MPRSIQSTPQLVPATSDAATVSSDDLPRSLSHSITAAEEPSWFRRIAPISPLRGPIIGLKTCS